MSIQLVGFSRCRSCAAEELAWRCPVCRSIVEEGTVDEDGDVVSLRGLRCGTCGLDREVVAYAVPEALTDFWFHEVRATERITVDYSGAKGHPTVLYLRGTVLRVESMLFFVRTANEAAASASEPHGAFLLRTEIGLCVVVAAPHELGEGEIVQGITDWHLVETDNSMRQQLAGELKALDPATKDSSLSTDEGLLRNANAYGVVFRIENALRVLLADRLKRKSGDVANWWGAVVPQVVRDQVEMVKARRRDSAWFGLPDEEPMIFTTLGQLRSLLEKDWSSLGSGLGPKEILLGGLLKLEFYRHELAHCRPLSLRMLSDLHEIERSVARIGELAV